MSTPQSLRPASRSVSARLRAVWVVSALAVAAALGAGPALADCADLQAKAGAAQAQGDVPALKAVFEQVAVEPSCDDAYRGRLGRAVARAIEKQVFQAVSAGQPLAPHEAALSDSLRYAPSWRALAWLGDIARERKEHALAAKRYQDSLSTIQDEVATPQAPPPEVIGQIFRQAEESRLLADTYVAAPVTRSGAPTGLAAASLRGFVPTKVALPVEFHFDSVQFTEKGAAAVADLLSTLRAQNAASVTLIGHTDARGNFDYNMQLSRRRAEAVRSYLLQAGFGGSVAIEGRGPTEPMPLDDPGRYTQAQVEQMNRRVELRR